MRHKPRIIQVSNIAPQTTKDQMSSLFGFLGRIEEIRLYPTVRDVAIPVSSRICFIKFQDRETVGVSQHLTNTVFIDRALVVIPYMKSDMPDEKTAMTILQSNSAIPGLSMKDSWPDHVTNMVEGIILKTVDPKLDENSLPPYPDLPATTESFKVNEIRRTVVFDNIHNTATDEEVLELAEKAGEVKYLRIGTEKDGTKNCLVEYAEQAFIIQALKLHDILFKDLPIIVNHSTVAVLKPETKTNEAAKKEIEEAMRSVREAQPAIFAMEIDPLTFLESSIIPNDKNSPSPSRSHSRSSRSRSHRATRSKSRSVLPKKRSRSRSKRRSKSTSRSSHRSSRNQRSRTPRRRSRSRSRKRSSRKDKDKEERKKRDDNDEKKRKDRKEEEDKPNENTEEREVSKEESKSPLKINESMESTEKSKLEETSEVEKEASKKLSKSSRNHSRSRSRDRKSHRSLSSSRTRKKSRSPSRSARKSRSPSRSKRKSPSPSRSKRKCRSSSRSNRKSRSSSRNRRKSCSRERRRRRSRSRSKTKRDKRRSRSRDKRRKSPSSSRDRRSHRNRSRSRDRKVRDKNRRNRDKKERKKDAVVSRNYDEEDERLTNEAKQDTIEETAVDMDISP